VKLLGLGIIVAAAAVVEIAAVLTIVSMIFKDTYRIIRPVVRFN
jgi:hypothetical protein